MTTSIYFIDSRVADIEALVAALPADSLWHLLDATQHGIEQMRAVVASYSELKAIHVVSHGASGSVLLGSTWLSNANLQDHAAALTQIGSSLSADGDLLLYGCDVAQGDAGSQFIGALALAMGANVAASTDVTGLAWNWIPEAASGVVEVTALSLNSYSSTLAVVSGNSSANTLTGCSGNDSISGLVGNDRLQGFDGADTLDGGSVADSLYGGASDDTYVVDQIGDLITELAGEGKDLVLTNSVSYI
jgi:Ca2+-binding RTX toxin-like protein